ncbi:MAG TPA: carbohydrate ABC transporter permease [bacterium]|nr:carbohydrate ABC transporter permease [bacterium]
MVASTVASATVSRRRRAEVSRQVWVVGLTVLSTVLILVPVAWMVSAAVRPIREVLNYPPVLWPRSITLVYFEKILNNPTYRSYFTNSIELSLGALILSLFFGSLAAYGFSRFRLPGGQVMLMAILSLLMLPRVVLIIPYFRLAHVVGLYDTVPGLIVANTAFLLPLSTWLIKAYLDSIPHELDEAALIDGCTRLQTLWKVVAPLAVPGVVGVAAFIFIGAWNEYLLAVVLTETTHSQTLTVGMSSFFGEYVRDWNGIMALTTMSSLPLVVIFVLLQRWVVQGLGSGAIK